MRCSKNIRTEARFFQIRWFFHRTDTDNPSFTYIWGYRQRPKHGGGENRGRSIYSDGIDGQRIGVFSVLCQKQCLFHNPFRGDDEKKYLALMAEGDEHARNMLIEHNLRLVAHIVKKFENTGEDAEDLISIGTIGLIKAIESYSSGKGTSWQICCAVYENETSCIYAHSKKQKRTSLCMTHRSG